ncbi:MAG TPA: lytic transglycosylase domain-containing protein [Coprothermobacter proteolyticus]|nr:lytic transglycosylase domain-containing protein [Coprothermobacter proteolyticus]
MTPILQVDKHYKFKNGSLFFKPNYKGLAAKILIIVSLLATTIIPKTVDPSSYKESEKIVFQEKRDEMVAYIQKVNPTVEETTAKRIVAAVRKYSEEHNVKPSLVFAVIEKESTFNPFAISNAGAIGLMQVLLRYHTDKLKTLAAVEKEKVNPFDIDQNIRLGTKILSEYIKMSKTQDEALRRYNGSLALETTYHMEVQKKKQKILIAMNGV